MCIRDSSGTDHTDRHTGKIRRALSSLRSRSHAQVNTHGRENPGIANATVLGGAAGGPSTRLGDDIHVLNAHPDVACGDVSTIERRDEFTEGAQQFRWFVRWVVHDDGFASTVGKSRECVFVGHRS